MSRKNKKKFSILLGSGITTGVASAAGITIGFFHFNHEYNPYLVSFEKTVEGDLTINIKVPNSKIGDKFWAKFIDKEKGIIWVEATINSEGKLVINTGDLPVPSKSSLDSIWKEKPTSSSDKPFIDGWKLNEKARETISKPDIKFDVLRDSEGKEINNKKVAEFNKQLSGKDVLFNFENLTGQKMPPIKGYINEDGKAIIDTSSLPLNDFYTLVSIVDAEEPEQKVVNLSNLERPITIDKLIYDSIRTHNDKGEIEIISGLSKENANKKIVAIFESKDGKKTMIESIADPEGKVIFNTSLLEKGEWYLQEIKDAENQNILKTRDQMDDKAEKAPIFMPSVLRVDNNKKEIFELRVDGHLIDEELSATFVGPAPKNEKYIVKAKVDSLGKVSFDTTEMPKGYQYTLESVKDKDGKNAINVDELVEKDKIADKRYQIPYYPNPKQDGDQPIWVPAIPNTDGKLVPDQGKLDEIANNPENAGKEWVANKDEIKETDGNGTETTISNREIVDGKDKISNSYKANFTGADDKTSYTITLRLDSANNPILDEEELKALPVGQKYNFVDIKDQNDAEVSNVNLGSDFNPTFDKSVTVTYNWNNAEGAAQSVKTITSIIKDGNVYFDTSSDDPLAKGYLYTLDKDQTSYANEKYVTDGQKASISFKETVDKRYQIPYYPNPKKDGDTPTWVPAVPNADGKLVPDQNELDKIKEQNPGKEFMADKSQIKENDGNGTETIVSNKEIVDGKDKIDDSYVATFIGNDGQEYKVKVILDANGNPIFDKDDLAKLPAGQDYKLKEQNGITKQNGTAPNPAVNVSEDQKTIQKGITGVYASNDNKDHKVNSEVRNQKDGNYSIYLKTSDDVLPKGYLYTLKNDSIVYAYGLTEEEKAKFVKEETVDKRYLIPYYPNPKTNGDQPLAWIPASPDANNPDQLIPDQDALDQMIKDNPGKEMVADTSNIQNNNGLGQPNGDVVQNPNKIIDGKEKIDNSYVSTFIGNDGQEYKVKVILDANGNPVFDKDDLAKLPAGQDYKLKEQNGITKQDGTAPNPAVNVSEAQKTIKKGITGIYTSNVNKEQKVDSEVRDQKDGNYSIYLKTSDDVLPKGYLYTLKNDSVVYADGLTAEEKAKFVKEETVDKRYLIPYYANPKTNGDNPIAWIPASPDPSNPDQLIPDQSALDQMIKENPGKEVVADTSNIQNNDGTGQPNGDVVQNPNKIIDGKEKIDNSYVANYSSSTDSSTIIPIKVVVLSDGSLKFDQTEIDNKLGPELWNLIDIKQNDGNTTALSKDDPKVPEDKKQIDRRLYATELVISEKDNQEKVDRNITISLNPARHSMFNGKYIKVKFVTEQDPNSPIWTSASQIDSSSNEVVLSISKDELKGNKEYKMSNIFFGDANNIDDSSTIMDQIPPLNGVFYVKPTSDPAISIVNMELTYKTITPEGPKVDLYFTFNDPDDLMLEGQEIKFNYKKAGDATEISKVGSIVIRENKKVISLPANEVEVNEKYVLTKVFFDNKPSRAYFDVGYDKTSNTIYDQTKTGNEDYTFNFEFQIDNLAASNDGKLKTESIMEEKSYYPGASFPKNAKASVEIKTKVYIKQISEIKELQNKKMKVKFTDNNGQEIWSEVLDSANDSEWLFTVPITPNRKYILNYIKFGDDENNLDKTIDIQKWSSTTWWFETEPSKTYFAVDSSNRTGGLDPKGNWQMKGNNNSLPGYALLGNSDSMNPKGHTYRTNPPAAVPTGYSFVARFKNFDDAWEGTTGMKVKYKLYVEGESSPREATTNLIKGDRYSIYQGQNQWWFEIKIGTYLDPNWVVDKSTKVSVGNNPGDVEIIYPKGTNKAKFANKPFDVAPYPGWEASINIEPKPEP